MKKRIVAVLLFVILGIGTALTVCATTPTFDIDGDFRLNDKAGLLTSAERKELSERLDDVSERHGLDVVIVTLRDLGDYDDPVPMADDIFDYCGYGIGAEKDGILLLVTKDDRAWAFSTHGKSWGIVVFTDAGQEYIYEQMRDDLSDGNYADAFSTFVDQCDAFASSAEDGEPYDRDNLPREPLSLLWIPVSLFIGFIIAKIAVACMKGKLKTVRRQAAANCYVKPDSLDLTESSDLFLYQTVSRTAKPKDDDNSSHSGGGSSTHTSSSGSTHGGSGGRY